MIIPVTIINTNNPTKRVVVELPMDENKLIDIISEIAGGESVYYEHDLFSITNIFDFNETVYNRLAREKFLNYLGNKK